MGSRDYALGIAAVLFASVVWGTTGTAATFAPDVGAAAIGAAAMGLGGIAQALFAGRSIAASLPGLLTHWRKLVLGGIAVAIYPLAFYGSMRLAGVTIGTVVTIGSAPLFSAMIEYVLDRQRLSPRWLIGAGIGLLGIVLLCAAKGAAHPGATGGDMALPGIGLGLIGGLTYALYSWTARGVMLRGIRSKVAMGATFGIGGLLLMPVLIATGGPFLQSWNNAAVGIYMALVPMFLGYLAFGYGLARIPASTATTVTLTEPVVAAVFAILIVGERLSAMGWLGVTLIVSCLIVITVPLRMPVRAAQRA
ncbi:MULTISPECIES: DMT family transporter [Paracoccus]|uniref:EamA family transporter n=1 Tax=Paracoccus litorisediminis TaxID=2006130 RepID=A0A844HLN8_9RHOB|nr:MULTISPECIES: EamA family transporter [Paracoccus]MBD9528489.1 EamA family transporter [Paracoccus sp. PAR01]MTH60776.1 EamA family transporter [Paracoccus litorisediminis]